MRQYLLFIPLLVTTALYSGPSQGHYTSADQDELRIELDDLKYALKTTQTELSILDERLKKQGSTITQNQGKDSSSVNLIASQVNALERKVSNLEKTLERASNDLRTLTTSLNQTLAKLDHFETNLSSHDKRLTEVSKLKDTLTSISKAVSQRPAQETPSTATKPYRVKAGDSLEKIARVNHVSVDSIRKLNNISNDKIVVGQELRLADEP
jgi:LysM repeat protein